MNESTQAEKSLIGAILLDNTSISKIYGRLLPEHFSNNGLSKIYKAMLNLYNNDKKIDAPTLVPLVDWDNTEQTLVSGLKQCINEAFSMNIVEYSEIIFNRYKLEKVQDIMISTRNVSASDINDQIGQIINKLTDLTKSNKSKTKTISEIFEENREKYFNPDFVRNYIYLGFPNLDQTIGGVEDTDLVLVAARPSVGKSALAYQMVLNLVKNGKKVVFYTLEMSESQLLDRMIAFEGGIPLDRVRNGKQFLNDEKSRFLSAQKIIESVSGNLLINESGSKSASEIRNECKFIEGLDLIVVDYLQLMKSEVNRKGNRTQEVGDISRGLKLLAKELHVPVIALSQLNRAVEGRQIKEPTMADIRESGDIEQDCDKIIMLWNTDESDKTQKGIKVEKNRQGELGKVAMRFNGSQMRFSETNYNLNSKPIPSGDSFVKSEKTPFDD